MQKPTMSTVIFKKNKAYTLQYANILIPGNKNIFGVSNILSLICLYPN